MKKKIVMKNVPGVSNVAGYVSIQDYYPRLRFDLFESSGHLPWFYRSLIMTATDDYEAKSRREWIYSNRMMGYIHYRLDTWTEFNNKLLENERFGRQLIRHIRTRPVFDEISGIDTNIISRMEAVFRYVQESYTWNGQYHVYAPRDLSSIPENGEASSGEINLILICLLRRAGFDADPVLIRTSNLGQPETVFPVHHQFNHVIALVNLNGEVFLLDAITKNKPYHELPDNDLHTIGWRVNKDDFGWIDINPK